MQTYLPFKKIRFLSTAFFVFISFSIFAQLQVSLNRTDSYYEMGEVAYFNITSNASGPVNYTLKYDNASNPISSGIINISSGQTQTISHQGNESGIVICTVNQYGNTATTAAAFSPYEMEAFGNEPADFDAFWNNQKSLLANVPINAQLNYDQSTPYSTTYRIKLGHIDNRTIYGFLTVPMGSGPFPAFVTFPAFGDAAGMTIPEVSMAERGNVLSLTISIHNTELYIQDPNAYEPDVITNKDSMYYRYAYLAGVRAIDYIFSRPDFDGENLGVTGVSQGAGLSTVVAGLDSRVKYLIMSNPVLGQLLGLQQDRAGGFPNYIQKSRLHVGTAAHEAAVAENVNYYDAIYFARRFNGKSWSFISYEDLVTPAATAFPVFNALRGQKFLTHSLNIGHFHPEDFWVGRMDFLRRFIPACQNPPFPYANTTLGYYIDAGENIYTEAYLPTNLSAVVEYNGTLNPSSYDLQWVKKEGPGNVNFSTPNSYNSTATFSSDGIYVLQFYANDYSNNLNAEQKYYTLVDEVTVTVGGGVITLQSQTISFNSISNKTSNSSPFFINATASSGLPVSFQVVSGPASIVGNQITLNGNLGTVTVKATQPGNNQFLPAPEVTRTFEVVEATNVICDAPANLALGKNTAQSSVEQEGTSDRAVDGNTNGSFWGGNSVAFTTYSNQPWWEVDLGKNYNLESINIWNRTDCCNDFFKEFYVFVSDVPFTSENISATLNQTGVEAFYVEDLVATPSSINLNTTGRYIRIQMVGSGFMSLAEVEVMGCEMTTGELQPQTISFDPIADKHISNTSFSLMASASSGLPVSFEVVSGPATVSGNEVMLDGVIGTVIIKAIQNGNNQYSAAPEVTQSFKVTDLEVSGCNELVNLSWGKSTSQSSVEQNGTSDRAVDGNTDGNFWSQNNSVAFTEYSDQPWWEVDLGEVSILSEIRIWNRTDCCNAFFENFYVLVSSTPFDSQDLNETLNQANVESFYVEELAGTPSIVQLATAGRYVRIQMAGSGFMSLAEVEVMGCSSSTIQAFVANEKEPDALLFPNPSSDFVHLKTTSFFGKKLNIQIINQSGMLVLEKRIAEVEGIVLEINTKELAQGIYFVKLDGEGFARKVLRLVVLRN